MKKKAWPADVIIKKHNKSAKIIQGLKRTFSILNVIGGMRTTSPSSGVSSVKLR